MDFRFRTRIRQRLFMMTTGSLSGSREATVGNALHKNPDPEHIPCFRVVNAKGELSGAFAFGGAGEQARRLEADGIEVQDGKVDLERYGFKNIF